VRVFAGNKDVVFADVNQSEAGRFGDPHNPGQGGWPTVRYFNTKTGVDGANYQKLTTKSMCEELVNIDYMIDYIEGAGNTVLCDLDGTNCNEKELGYIEKMKDKSQPDLDAAKERLGAMDVSKMKPELQDWNYRRGRILVRLLRNLDIKTEL